MKPYDVLFEQVFKRIEPERIHHRAFRAIRAAEPLTSRLLGPRAGRGSSGQVQALGLTFPHPLGLAAGFDKNAVGIDALAGLGFGHVEVGTVTGQAQPGNPQPRLFRLPADRAIINRMGFNNDGAEVVARRIARWRATHPAVAAAEARTGRTRFSGPPILGVNIGKTKIVTEDDAIGDYELSTGFLAPYADYLVVNVSSPNTPGLRNLQAVEKLEPLLTAVRRRADQVRPGHRVPLLVKIAPDLSDEDVLAVADLALAINLDGIIATNTTISRRGLATADAEVEQIGLGGLSGRPLTERAEDVMRALRGRVGADLTLVGVGGITTIDDARRRLAAGADLLQAYTAFVFEGPLWPRRIVRGLSGNV